jgi:hypothetical protein
MDRQRRRLLLTYVSDDVRRFASARNVPTKDDWRANLTGFV